MPYTQPHISICGCSKSLTHDLNIKKGDMHNLTIAQSIKQNERSD